MTNFPANLFHYARKYTALARRLRGASSRIGSTSGNGIVSANHAPSPTNEPVVLAEQAPPGEKFADTPAALRLDAIDIVQAMVPSASRSAAVGVGADRDAELGADTLVEAGPLTSVAVSIAGDTPARFLDMIAAFLAQHPTGAVHLGLEGEPLSSSDWFRFARSALDNKTILSIATNLAAALNDEELELLSRFRLIFVKIDALARSPSEALRGADSRTLLYNFHRIRARALQQQLPMPEFAWSCSLAPDALSRLDDILPLARRYGVKYLFLNDPPSPDGATQEANPLLALDKPAFEAAAATLDRVLAFCAAANIRVHAPWKDALDRERLARGSASPSLDRCSLDGGSGERPVAQAAELLEPGMTRMCLQPWNSIMVTPDSTLYTCAHRRVPMGRPTTAAELDSSRNGTAYLDLRRQLVTGDLVDESCRRCPSMHAVTPDRLIDAVRNVLAARDGESGK